MSKKVIKIIISSFIVMFSFFYTNTIIKTLKENDPIYVKIKKYEEKSSNNQKEKIDVEKSYKKMKRAGNFDKNLMVFQETNTSLSYKEFINNINQLDNSVCLIFLLKDTDNILSIIKILNEQNVKATFFLNSDIFDRAVDIVKLINDNGHQIELSSNTYSVYEVNKYSSLLKLITKNKLNFCLNKNKDNQLLKSCESSKLYSIVPTITINNRVYLNIKNKLNSGSIIELDNSNNTVKELSITIRYILQKGKKIVLLKSII